jgi:arabinose-5-phosphate isomerase
MASSQQSKVQAIINQSMTNDANCLNGLLKSRLDSAIISAIDLFLNRKGDVFVVGTGTSGHLAKKLAASLTSISIPAHNLDATGAKHGDAGYLKDDSFVVFISKSGNTEELVEFFNLNASRIGTSISIVGECNSFLGKNSTHTISFGFFPESDPLGIVPTSSAVATMAVFNALVSGLMFVTGFKSEDFLRNHPKGSLGQRLSTRFSDVMHSSIDHPSVIDEFSTLLDGINAISAGRLGASFIVDSNHNLLGLFTDGDMRRYFQSNSPKDLHIRILDLASRDDLIVATPDSLVFPFIEEMESSKRVLVIPVVSNNRLVGMTHIHDVVSHAVGV